MNWPITKKDRRKLYRKLRRKQWVSARFVASMRPRRGFEAPDRFFIALLEGSHYRPHPYMVLNYFIPNNEKIIPWKMEFE